MNGEYEVRKSTPTRKRARKFARPTEKVEARRECKFTDEEIEAIYRYTSECEVCRIYAAAARRAGDPTVSPRDYYCGCAPSSIDCLPICEEKKPGCRFVGRLSPAEIGRHLDETQLAGFRARIASTIKDMQGANTPVLGKGVRRYLRRKD